MKYDQARRESLRLAITYAAVATLWILVSDTLVGRLGLPAEGERFLASIKGVLFVLVTASMLYVLASRAARRFYSSQGMYRCLFEGTNAGLLVFRAEREPGGGLRDLVVQDANPTEVERTGMEQHELVGARTLDAERLPAEVRGAFDLVRRAHAAGEGMRETQHYEETDRYHMISAYRIDDDMWVSSAVDITEVRRAQEALRAQEEGIRQAYVDVLDAVTGGKLVLMTEEEVAAALGETLAGPLPIHEPVQLSDARASIHRAVCGRFPNAEDPVMLQNAVGEALNNALKHAGGGEYSVHATEGRVQVLVSDRGPGIDFRTLPRATLVAGFSTASTLGMGFTIMLQICDRVLLATGPGGTRLVLELSPAHVNAHA